MGRGRFLGGIDRASSSSVLNSRMDPVEFSPSCVFTVTIRLGRKPTRFDWWRSEETRLLLPTLFSFFLFMLTGSKATIQQPGPCITFPWRQSRADDAKSSPLLEMSTVDGTLCRMSSNFHSTNTQIGLGARYLLELLVYALYFHFDWCLTRRKNRHQ